MLRTGAVTRQTGRCCKAAPPTTKCKLQRGVGIDKKIVGSVRKFYWKRLSNLW
jgi:hypothetical protein